MNFRTSLRTSHRVFEVCYYSVGPVIIPSTLHRIQTTRENTQTSRILDITQHTVKGTQGWGRKPDSPSGNYMRVLPCFILASEP